MRIGRGGRASGNAARRHNSGAGVNGLTRITTPDRPGAGVISVLAAHPAAPGLQVAPDVEGDAILTGIQIIARAPRCGAA